MRALKVNYLPWLVVLCLVLGAGTRPATASPIIRIQPSSSTVTTGSFFDVFVEISPVTDLFAYQFDITFDPAIVSAVSISEGPFLATGGSTFFIPGSIDNTAGTITFTANSLLGALSGVTGNGTLADVQFSALSEGTSVIALSNVQLLDSTLNDISVTTADGTVGVSRVPVPEPGTFSILLAGLSVLGLVARSRKRRTA